MTDTPTTELPAVKVSHPEALPAAPAMPRERAPSPRRSRGDEVKTVSEIASAIAKITSEVGIVPKLGENRFHNYKYAKMSDVLIRLTPLLAEHGIVVLQTELERSMFDDGRVLAVQYEFTISHKSGEVWPDRPRQTGVCRCRDSKGGWDDKAFNKCHTAARKYFLLALFQIATDEEHDADEDRDLVRETPRRRPAAPAPNAMQDRVDPLTGEIVSEASVPSAAASDAAAVSASAARADETAAAPKYTLDSIEHHARAAADRGSVIFRTFWRNCSGEEQAAVLTIGDDLRERINAADAKLKLPR
jgi:hypothetical protein